MRQLQGFEWEDFHLTLLVFAYLLANYAGLWLVRRTPAELFFRIAYVLMFLISIELIRGAVVEMLRG